MQIKAKNSKSINLKNKNININSILNRKKKTIRRRFWQKKYKALNAYSFFWLNKQDYMSWSINKFYKKMTILTKFFRNFIYLGANKTQRKWKRFLSTRLKKNAPLNIFSFIWYLEHRLDCLLVNYFYSKNLQESFKLIKKGYVYLNFKKVLNPYKIIQMGSILQFSFFFLLKDKITNVYNLQSSKYKLNSISFVLKKTKLIKKKSRTGSPYNKLGHSGHWWAPSIFNSLKISDKFVEQNRRIQSLIFLQNGLLKGSNFLKKDSYCFGKSCKVNKAACCFKNGIKIKNVPFFILYEQRFFF